MARGRYALYGEIGSGGMAKVHVGRRFGDGGFTTTVAIKRLASYLTEMPEAAKMLADEARMASRIAHANVVAMHDVVMEGTELFLVMEHVLGASLSQLIKAALARGTRIPPSVVRAIVAGMLRGLHAAHEAGVIHRDVSPSNVIVGVDGLPRVLDFGIAKAEDRATQTTGGERKGKLGFMSPEQLVSSDVDRRSDVFSAGVVYWEALAQKRLFPGSDEEEIRQRVVDGVIPPPSSAAANVSPEDDVIVLRALRRDPEERYATAADMADAIEATGELAPQSEVARWVNDLAKDAIEARRGLLDEMTRTEPVMWIARAEEPARPRDASPASIPASAPAPPHATRASIASLPRHEKETKRDVVRSLAPVLLATLGAVLVATAALVIVTRRSEPHPPPPLAPVVDPLPPSAAPPVTPSASPATAAADPAPPPSPTGVVKPKRSKPPAPAPTGARRCDPPFTIDSAGVKIWKEDCLH